MTPYRYRRRSFCIYMLATALFGGVAETSNFAQQHSDGGNVSTPRFDVVSVKENKSNDRASTNVPLDRSNTFTPTQGRFAAVNQSLIGYIIFAYKMKVTESYGGLMAKLPDWAKEDRFDILARTDSVNASKDDLREMVRGVLEDRFQLQAHRQQSQTDVYGLYPSDSKKSRAVQLQPHAASQEPCAHTPFLPPPATPVQELLGKWPGRCGDGGQTQRSRFLSLTGGRNMTMTAIADWLTGAADLDRPILDKTGLSGTFDFIVEFTPEYLEDLKPSGSQEAPGPGFVSALNDQLGLKLKKETGTTTLFVVDHVAYPSQN